MRTHADSIPRWRKLLWRRARVFHVIMAGTWLLSHVVGCKDTLSNPSLPDGVLSPEIYFSKAGALALTQTAVSQFKSAYTNSILLGGLLTDEFSINEDRPDASYMNVDSRYLPENNADIKFDVYPSTHALRAQTHLARGVLAGYASDLSPAILGQLYAFEGYAELWLADLYCSGVPLSTLDFGADFTLRPSSKTVEVYAHAVTLFDSALALSADSVNVQTLAAVGKGRALLALGRYADAAAAVASVPSDAAYKVRVQFVNSKASLSGQLYWRDIAASDREGENGFEYRTSGDPRTRSVLVTIPKDSKTPAIQLYYPAKWSNTDTSVVTVASGIEAALIVAEAELQQGHPEVWLSMLNALRTTGTYSRIDTATSGTIDTLWTAGSGGVAGLRPLADPVTANLRIDLMFAERAAWLYVSGHRQGDLRRLVREYGRPSSRVYPSGTYGSGGLPGYHDYMDDVAVPIPASEKRNPYFRGCLSRDA